MTESWTILLASAGLGVFGWFASKAISWVLGRLRDLSRDDGSQASQISAIVNRVGHVEATVLELKSTDAKIVEILERLARIEEWRSASDERLDEADDTSRAVVQIGEQMRTVFKRMDCMPREVANAVISELRQNTRRAAAP